MMRKPMKRLAAAALAAATLMGLAAGCQKSEAKDGPGAQPSQSAPGAPSAPSGGKKDTLVFALSADINVLDPAFTASATDNAVNSAIYDGLVKLTPEGEFAPAIAETWEVSADGLTYTFNLRQDVTFHNGEKLTADDVVFSAERAMPSSYVASTFGKYCVGAEKIDDYTVALKLSQPYAPFLRLCQSPLVIHSKKAVEEAGSDEAYFEHPVGAGPYEFVEHKSGESVTLKAFDGYYGSKPAIPNVKYRIITDPNTTSISVETGEIDFCGYMSTVPSSNLPLLEENENLKVTYADSIQTYFIIMNTETAPFDNIKVRQAIAHAVDKQFIVDVVEGGKGKTAKSMNNELVFGYTDVSGYEYDVEKAKQLLADAGYPGGEGIPKLTFKLMEGKPKTASEAIQSQLQAIGIEVELLIEEKNAYISEVLSGDFTIGYIGITLGTDSAMYSQTYCTSDIGNLNLARYSNPQVDQMFQEAETTSDSARRKEIYAELFTLLDQECVYVPLYFPQNAYVYNKNLQIGQLYPDGVYVQEMSFVQ